MVHSARMSGRRLVLVVALALAVLGGAALATWAVRAGPFAPESHCWGAWAEDSGPRVLGADYARVAEESGSPHRGEQAVCVMAYGVPGTEEMQHPDTSVTGDRAREGTGGDRLVARVGPPPRSTGGPRRAWLAEALHGNTVPLPEGLPGVVSTDRGTLVLPEECDSGDVPLVVTVRSEGQVPELDSEREVTDLLLSLAETAREKAGCDGGRPTQLSAPVPTVPDGRPRSGGGPACRIAGMRFAPPAHGELAWYASAVGTRLQSCSLELSGDGDERDGGSEGNPGAGDDGQQGPGGKVAARGQFVVTSHPRLVRLFAGMAGERSPGDGWRGTGRIERRDGLVTAECRGRPTVFFLHLDGPLASSAEPDVRHLFARSADSVTERLGCPAVGPRS